MKTGIQENILKYNLNIPIYAPVTITTISTTLYYFNYSGDASTTTQNNFFLFLSRFVGLSCQLTTLYSRVLPYYSCSFSLSMLVFLL